MIQVRIPIKTLATNAQVPMTTIPALLAELKTDGYIKSYFLNDKVGVVCVTLDTEMELRLGEIFSEN